MNQKPFIYCESPRLILRDYSPADFEAVHAYSSDPENVAHMVYGPNTPEQTRTYLEKTCPAEAAAEPRMHYNFALALRGEDRVIGGISLHMNWRRDDAIIGMILNKLYAGRGLTTEGLAAVLDYAFGPIGLHRVHAVCDVDNTCVIHVFEKLGFRREGRMVQRGKSRPEAPSEYFDQYAYAILRQEWRSRDKRNGSNNNS
jgi:RimJ/RimL family protein N-acetyltransferase